MQVPLHDLIHWPANEIEVYKVYLNQEPAPVERVEPMLAQLTALFYNANANGSKSLSDFLLWKQTPKPISNGSLSALDMQLVSRLKGLDPHG